MKVHRAGFYQATINCIFIIGVQIMTFFSLFIGYLDHNLFLKFVKDTVINLRYSLKNNPFIIDEAPVNIIKTGVTLRPSIRKGL